MHGDALLRDLALSLGVSIGAVCLLRRVGLPSVVGYLLAGFLMGPSALAVVENADNMRAMSEIGLVFLLFATGLRFSLRELASMRGLVLGAGTGQVVLCTLLGFAAGNLLGLPTAASLVVGFVLSLSSTALVAKLLEERGEVGAPHGRVGMGILLAQDLAVVPLLVIVSALSGESATWGGRLLQVGKPIVLLAAILGASLYLVPRLLHRVVATRSRELLNLTIVAIAVGTAFVTGEAGVPLELGAFLAGVIVSESDYADHVLSEIAPLRDVFSGLFFVSIGMLVDPAIWARWPLLLGGAVLLTLFGKGLIVAVLALAFRFDVRAALIAGLGLGQIGEFSYILAQVAADRGLLEPAAHAAIVSVAAVTMAATPLVFLGATKVAGRLDLRRLPLWMQGASACRRPEAVLEDATEEESLADHVILVGFGPSGRNIARGLRAIGARYVALELNPLTVASARAEGHDVRYGDAGRVDTLRKVGLPTARALVISTADPTASRLVTSVARQHRADLLIIARTRYVADLDELHEMGANAVASEDFETSIAITGMLLHAYGCAPSSIDREQHALRRRHYAQFRGALPTGPPRARLAEVLGSVGYDEVTLEEGHAAIGHDLAALDLRGATGALVVALERDSVATVAPSPSLALREGDRLLVAGDSVAIAAARRLLMGSPAPSGESEAPESPPPATAPEA